VADYFWNNLYISNAQWDICARIIQTQFHHAFPRVLHAYSVILPRVGSRPIPSASFIIYNSIVFYIQWSVHRVICGNNYPKRWNNIQFIYICKLLHMFRVAIIIQKDAIIYSLFISVNYSTCSNLVTFTTGSSNGLINATYCRYSDMSCWWLVEIPLETCRVMYRYK